MLDLTWLHLGLVHLLWVALAAVITVAVLDVRSADAMTRVLSRVMARRLATGTTRGQRIVRWLALFACLALGVGALMRPQRPGGFESLTTSSASADIMVVLDVSKSMLAEDAAPTRLGRAKAEIASLVDKLRGHRLGLVAFAGRAATLCPLTPDYNFFRMILRGVDTKSVSHGGTRIGDALETAIEGFKDAGDGRVILLITDGEDHDSFAERQAEIAKAEGIRIVTIGFGSEEGSSITLVDPDTGARTTLTDKSGNIVTSKLNGNLLRKMALTTDGVYVPAGVSAVDLDSILESHLRPMVREQLSSRRRRAPTEYAQWFVLGSLAFFLMFATVGIPSRREAL